MPKETVQLNLLTKTNQEAPRIEGSSAGAILGISDITENHTIWRMLIAECLGTLILVFICCGSCIGLSQSPEYVPYVQIALTFGFTVASLAQAIGHVSGCHINPAVTVSFVCTGKIKLIRALLYIIVQCVGAIGGSALLRLVTPDEKIGNLGLTVVSPQLTVLQGLLVEIIITFLLVFVVHSVCDTRRKDVTGSIPVAIGLAVSAAHLCGIQYTGSSINPARTFGPAVIMNSWENHWVYWVGPILGGVIAGLVYRTFFRERKSEPDSYNF